MLALIDGSVDLKQAARELRVPYVGQLLTPLTRFRLKDPTLPWAIDNGAYSKFDDAAYWRLLEREYDRRGDALFVTIPDIVGSAIRTLEIFEYYRKYKLRETWRIALVAQDGQERLPIPWDDIDAIFIGGTTQWKMSTAAAQIIKTAKIIGKHVHVGRINTPDRWDYFEALDVDTCDGSGLARYSHMREAIALRPKKGGLFT